MPDPNRLLQLGQMAQMQGLPGAQSGLQSVGAHQNPVADYFGAAADAHDLQAGLRYAGGMANVISGGLLMAVPPMPLNAVTAPVGMAQGMFGSGQILGAIPALASGISDRIAERNFQDFPTIPQSIPPPNPNPIRAR